MIAIMSDSKNKLRGNEASGTMACIATVYKNFDEAHSRVRVLISLQDFGRHLMFYIPNICRLFSQNSLKILNALLNLGIRKILVFALLLALRVGKALEFVRPRGSNACL